MGDSRETNTKAAEGSRMPAPRVLAALAVALLAVGLVAATGAGSQGSARAGSAQKIVAVVESASGQLSVKRHANGKLAALHSSGRIYFGDTVIPGRGAAAKFKATVPKGVSPDAQLFYIRPVAGTPHTVTMHGAGNTVEVTLAP
jgi:hypothetical protein